MAAELPARVEAVDGATVVDFPWEAASNAIDALEVASSTLDSQLGTRADMVGTLDDWEGSFRDEFNDAHDGITSTASGLKEELTSVASRIVGGAESANEAQRQNNYSYELGRALVSDDPIPI